jgi:hypothetical protein
MAGIGDSLSELARPSSGRRTTAATSTGELSSHHSQLCKQSGHQLGNSVPHKQCICLGHSLKFAPLHLDTRLCTVSTSPVYSQGHSHGCFSRWYVLACLRTIAAPNSTLVVSSPPPPHPPSLSPQRPSTPRPSRPCTRPPYLWQPRRSSTYVVLMCTLHWQATWASLPHIQSHAPCSPPPTPTRLSELQPAPLGGTRRELSLVRSPIEPLVPLGPATAFVPPTLAGVGGVGGGSGGGSGPGDPFVTPRFSSARRASEAGACAPWGIGTGPGPAGVVFVTPRTLNSSQCNGYPCSCCVFEEVF